MHACRYLRNSHLVGCAVLYVSLALAILAQTISFAIAPAKSARSSVAFLRQVAAPVDIPRRPELARPGFAWLPLVGLELPARNHPHLGDQPLATPVMTLAGLAHEDLPLEFDAALFHFLPSPQLLQTSSEPVKIPDWPAGRVADRGAYSSALAAGELIALAR